MLMHLLHVQVKDHAKIPCSRQTPWQVLQVLQRWASYRQRMFKTENPKKTYNNIQQLPPNRNSSVKKRLLVPPNLGETLILIHGQRKVFLMNRPYPLNRFLKSLDFWHFPTHTIPIRCMRIHTTFSGVQINRIHVSQRLKSPSRSHIFEGFSIQKCTSWYVKRYSAFPKTIT